MRLYRRLVRENSNMQQIFRLRMRRKRFTVGLAIATVGLLANQMPFSTALLAADTNSTHQFVQDGVLISLQEPSLSPEARYGV